MIDFLKADLFKWVPLWVGALVLTLLSNSSTHPWWLGQVLFLVWLAKVALAEEVQLGETLMGLTTNDVDTNVFSLVVVLTRSD
ncbi:hypothetical protein QQF64_001167 [Cirrhinus molitorella]|uniref:Uncharacterized protein n=1 Tax=Cirrhinus molitorella TaxID=172907 RepID=A0ABR3NZM1_9TELE